MHDFHFLPVDDLCDGEIYLRLGGTEDADPARGFVPMYILDICRVDTLTPVGRVLLRVGESERTLYGGQVGYEVAEEQRGRHYAAKAVALVKKLAARHGMARLTLTIAPWNIPSQRVAVQAGAEYVETLALPPHSDPYQRGEREMMVYVLRTDGHTAQKL